MQTREVLKWRRPTVGCETSTAPICFAAGKQIRYRESARNNTYISKSEKNEPFVNFRIQLSSCLLITGTSRDWQDIAPQGVFSSVSLNIPLIEKCRRVSKFQIINGNINKLNSYRYRTETCVRQWNEPLLHTDKTFGKYQKTEQGLKVLKGVLWYTLWN